MAFIGIDTVVFGASDLRIARRFFGDWGLRKLKDNASGLIFETGIGSQVVVRAESARNLPGRLSGGSNFREVVWGVATPMDLDIIGDRLSRDRPVRQDKSGTLHTVDDAGVNLGFTVWRRKRDRKREGTPFNGPGHRVRIDRVALSYERARPWRIGHVVFLVPDVRAAENFYVDRLGFALSDRYAGGAGVFLRHAKRSDHHNLFFIKSRDARTDLHHVAFEVRDIHEVFGGGLHFSQRGWATEVGPGRHPISSAYFWYFRNPLGGAIEYFSDPDYVTEKWRPTNFRVNRFSEWHLPDGIREVEDSRLRPPLAAAKSAMAVPNPDAPRIGVGIVPIRASALAAKPLDRRRGGSPG
jgi:catechol 2,3-dioxygenase-like lactoylglutathione lyase family enzyme